MTAAPTLADAVAYVLTTATEDDLDRVYAACKQRTSVLRSIRAATVTVGDTKTLTGISPKTLSGLTGTVTAIRGQRADVTLDAASTDTLRWAGLTRFPVPADTTGYLLRGVPLSCLTD